MKQAYGRIIEMILSGELMPGDALQEARLGEALAMSRTPVREAIKRIEAEGLAVQSGRFLKVRQLSCDEVEEIFFLRQVLETACARAATTLAPGELDAIETRIHVLRREGPGEDDEQRSVDDDFHRMLAAAAGSRMMVETIDDLRRRTCIFDHSLLPGRFDASCREHLEIVAALREGDREKAGLLMGHHIAHAKDAIIERLRPSQESVA